MHTSHTPDAATTASRTFPALLSPSLSPEGRPLVRVYTLGPLQLEWVGVPESFPEERLHKRGAAPALALLKALISRPHRYAARDWLCEHLHSAEEDALTYPRLDDIASLLRGLLCPEMEEKGSRDALRRELLSYVHSASESGPGYRLGSHPLIWVDIDTLAWNVEQACRLERFGEDALPLWERAYALARRGEYLPDESYSDWAEPRRVEAARYLRQSVHALARHYLSQPDARGEEEALRLLGDYWQRHVEDEDALRPLMELLGKHERYQEALSYYARLCEVLEEEGRTPDTRTIDLKEFLRAKQLQRSLPRTQVNERVLPVRDLEHPQWPASSAPMFLPRLTQGVIAPSPALDLLAAFPKSDPDDMHSPGACFALGASNFGALLERGWSIDALLHVLQVILPVVKAMPAMTRRTFLQAGAATALLGGFPIFESKQISEEESTQLCLALGESIQSSWKLFLSTENKVMLATGQALLALVQQAHPLLYPAVRPFLYTGAYGLIGIALHFQERDHEALQAYQSSYIAALSSGDPWYVAQSLICQSDSYHTLGQYDQAIQKIEEALRILDHPTDEAQRRAKAHLLTCWADNAMMLADHTTAQEKLEAAAVYLDQLTANEEFDRAGWLLLTGKYALMTGEYERAKQAFEQALSELPEHWTLRRAMTATGLAMAYARLRERDGSLQVAQSAASVLETINAPKTNHWFTQYLQRDLLGNFPGDERVRTFVSDTYHKLPHLTASSQVG